MKWEGREESQNVDDRRGTGKKVGLAVGGGGALLIVILGLVGLATGVIDPQQFAALVGQNQGGMQPDGRPVQARNLEEDKQAKFSRVVLRDTEVVWGEQFRKMGKKYQEPTMVFFDGQVESACGEAKSAVGPFYCPRDHEIYIDLSFYRDLERKLNAPGDFAKAYVIAHEVGHHVQLLLGYSKIADKARHSGNDVETHHASVRLELQADYLAGVWAHHAQEKFHFLEKGDVESALHAAFEIGDDRLQNKARGYVVPDSFTHGTSKQRMRWFNEGFKTGDVNGARRLFELGYNEL